MKKILLSIVFALISLVTAYAANLNPFAYGLKSTYDARTVTLSGEFYINAPATSVTTYAVDEGGLRYQLHAYGKVSAKGKITFSYDLLKLRIPTNIPLTWCVEVVGQNPSSPTFVDNSNKFYAPYSIDIDNNPQNANFGTVFCVEGRPDAEGEDKYKSYLSYTDGAGIYVLDADGTARPIPNQSKLRYGYNGGRVKKGQQYFLNSSYPAHSPNRVRVSDCGRIFVTSFTPDGEVLWEINNEVFSTADQPNWSSKTEWGRVISSKNDGVLLQETVKKDGGTGCNNHEYCNIFNLYSSSTGDFIAGPNVGFDVQGSGDNLRLLMLSGCRQAITQTTPTHYYCSEYNLGTKTKWNTAPSKQIFKGHVLNYAGAQVQYDKTGNVWMCQYRATSRDDYPYTLLKINRSGTLVHTEKNKLYRRCGAIRFNEDFSQVVIASPVNDNGGGFTLYPVGDDGMPIWSQGVSVNTYAKTGYSHMDYAWDYANNLYIAADNTTNGECIAIYAMPRASEKVSTPAAAKYGFTINCDPSVSYTIKTVCDANKGSVTCTPAAYAKVVGTGMSVQSCTELTLTVTPNAAYKFINWTDQNSNVFSTEKTVTFSVSENLTLTANFEYAEYTGITWWNLFKDGEEIEATSTAYPNTNERLWRLFQVELNALIPAGSNKRGDQGTDTWNGKKQFDVLSFIAGDATNERFYNLIGNSNEPVSPLRWMAPYFEWVIKEQNKKHPSGNPSGYIAFTWKGLVYNLINRASRPLNSEGKDVYINSTYIPADYNVDFTGEYGQMEKWRPWWTRIVCGLPDTLTYDQSMPIIWNKENCNTGAIAGITPSGWYKWNNVNTTPWNGSNDTHILAWRANSTTGSIVHHVTQNNMKLYATYVKKIIEETDPKADPTTFDANNYDVITLMSNPRYTEPHKLQVIRKLQPGMYNTICLPFDVDLTGLMDDHPLKYKADGTGATVLKFTGVTSTRNQAGEDVTILNFTQVLSMEKGKAYLIKLKDGASPTTDPIPFSGIVNTNLTLTPVASETYNGVTFHATINPEEDVPAGSLILVADNRLAQTTEVGRMEGMRGYFSIDPMWASDIAEQAADGRVYLSVNKPVTSSIPVAPEAEQQVLPKARKVMYDGKIYIIRGDEVYTITGNRVK